MAKKRGKFQQREADQIDAYYREMSGASAGAKKKNSAKTVIITLLALLVVAGGILGTMIYFNGGVPMLITGNSTMESGVTIGGISVGGMNKEEAIATVSDALNGVYSQPMTVTVLGETIEITASESGVKPDVEEAVKDAFACGTEKNPQLQLNLTPYLNLDEDAIRGKIQEIGQKFPTEGVETAYEIVQTGADNADVLKLTVGTEYYDFDADALYAQILEAYGNRQLSVNYTCNQMNTASLNLDAIYAEHCVDVVNAELDLETLEVSQSVAGYRFDLEAAVEALANAQPGQVLEFPFETVEPTMTTENLQSMLFRDVLGTCTAYQSSSSNRITNLRLACEALDGTILNPGDTFGYNAALGERTAAKGYKPASAYFNGKTIQSYGGGICQPSSALYYSCLHADLEIVQRHCHTYPSSYVPFGMDATVDWSGPDFKFRNNTDYPIRIDAKADGGQVIITLMGTDTKDYYVKMEYEILSVSSPSVIYKEVTADSGFKDGEVESSPHTGYTVQTYKLKYSKETDELISREKEAYSAYSKSDKVVYKVITDETTEPTDPTPTEPKPTEPKPTEPAPTEPKPTEPAPTEPKPTEPAPTEPKPTEPAPTEPKPTTPPATESQADSSGE